MTHADSSVATDSGTPPPRSRRQWLWPAHAALALVIIVGGVWALGRDEATAAPPATSVQQTDDHPVAAHGDSQSHAAAPNTDDPQIDAHGEHGTDAAHTEPDAQGHDEPDAHSAAETPAHDDHAAADHADTEVATDHADTEAAHADGGHGDEAAPVPASTRQVVLGGFAGVNVLAIVAAGILRRRNPPRLPKHLQR